jgi:hypothetical protein
VQVAQRRPAGFLAIPALFAPVAVCGIPGHTTSGPQLSAEAAVLALVVGVVGFESTVSLGLISVGTSLLSLNGFAEDSYGQLGWHPGVDLRAAAVLGAALVLACAARLGADRAQPGPPAGLRVPAQSHVPAQSDAPTETRVPTESHVPTESRVPTESHVAPESHVHAMTTAPRSAHHRPARD